MDFRLFQPSIAVVALDTQGWSLVVSGEQSGKMWSRGIAVAIIVREWIQYPHSSPETCPQFDFVFRFHLLPKLKILCLVC